MTGATPNTEWLNGCLALDDHGFIKTGVDLTAADLASARCKSDSGGRPRASAETPRAVVAFVPSFNSGSGNHPWAAEQLVGAGLAMPRRRNRLHLLCPCFLG